MRFHSHNTFFLILVLIAGALIGGLIGDALSSVPLSGIMPYLTHNYEFFDLQNIHLNLSILQISLGIRFAPNLISILGILIAAWIFHRF